MQLLSVFVILTLRPKKLYNAEARQWMRRTFRQFWSHKTVFKARLVFFVGQTLSNEDWIRTVPDQLFFS